MSNFFEIDYNDYKDVVIAAPHVIDTTNVGELKTVADDIKATQEWCEPHSISSVIAKQEGLLFVTESCDVITKEFLEAFPERYPTEDYDLYTARMYRVILKDVDQDRLLYCNGERGVRKEFHRLVGDNCGTYVFKQMTKDGKKIKNAFWAAHSDCLHYILHLSRKPRIYAFINDICNLKRLYDDDSKYKLKELMCGMDLYRRIQLEHVKAIAEQNGFIMDTGFRSITSTNLNNTIAMLIDTKYQNKIAKHIHVLIDKLKEEDKELIRDFTTLGINVNELYDQLKDRIISSCRQLEIQMSGKKGLDNMINLIKEGEQSNDK